jgi:UDP-3-O-[3-hydroxymyristoyl] glucosamine N-acyltransferase
MRVTLRLGDIVARLGGELIGDPQTTVAQVGTLKNAGSQHISFFNSGKYRDDLRATQAGAVIVAQADREATQRPRIVCDDPYLYFAKVSLLLNPPEQVEPGIHPTALIAANAQIDAGAQIGANCIIEADVNIESGVAIGPGCMIGAGSRIGKDSRLHARVTLYTGCMVGERVIVHSGAVLGADGFGFAPYQGRWVKIPQIGRVIVGNDVEIGANTTIDRGALDDTVIEEGVKLDNQIQIGHNVRIGAHSAVAGCTGIAGSTTIGKHCMIGGAAMIGGHLEIGDRVIISGGTWVTRSIEEPGMYGSVIPATPIKEWRRTVAHLRGLDRMNQRLRQLTRGGTEQDE